MKRRDAIKRTTLLLGGTLSASAILGVMSGCKADPVLNWTPAYLNLEEASIIEKMVDRIIPATDTPGAIDAGVPIFIDRMMADFYQEKEKSTLKEGIKKVAADAKAAYGSSFTDLTEEQQIELLTKYDQEAYSSTTQQDHFFKTIKELTILGFCTSEAGATEFLEYDPVPGEYKGCIPYSEIGKTWATS